MSLTFAYLFSFFKARSTLTSLEKIGDCMAELGLTLDSSTYSHWQRGTRIPKNRITILKLIKVLYQHQGIRSIEEANQMLASVAMPSLTDGEGRYLHNRHLIEPPYEVLNKETLTEQSLSKQVKTTPTQERLEIVFNLILPTDMHDYIHFQAKRQGVSKATLIRRMIENHMLEEDYTF